MNSAFHVLIVEDDADVAMACEQALQLEGFDCGCMSSAEMALKHLSPDLCRVVVTDIRLSGKSGLALLADIRAMDADLPVILITGHGDISMAVQAMKDGAADFLEKPFAPERLVSAVRRAMEQRQQALQVRSQPALEETAVFNPPTLLGQSAAMQQLRRMARGIASSDADVLVCGETGSGKAMLALSLHEASPRAAASFVALHCDALDDALFDSALTMQVKGGTLFLHEIEKLSLERQFKLLRVLQQRVLQSSSGSGMCAVDCRVIVGSSADLHALSSRGQFRADLYHHLSVVTMNLPPLRERREDIAQLFESFAQQAAEQHQRPLQRLSPEHLQALMTHTWPGNVRELRQLAERMTLGLAMGLGLDMHHETSQHSAAIPS